MKVSSLKEEKFVVLIKETNDFDEINNFFMSNYWSKTGIFVKLMRKVSMKWTIWSDFKAQHSTQLRGENWSKIEILLWNLLARYRNCKNEINCMNGSRDFQDAESVRSGQSHVASQSEFIPISSRSWWDAKPFCGNAEPQKKMARHAFGTNMVHRGKFFANPTASSSAPYPQELNPWSWKNQNTHHN